MNVIFSQGRQLLPFQVADFFLNTIHLFLGDLQDHMWSKD